MHITLINPPQLSTPYLASDAVVPPLGLLYISSVLKKNEFHVQLIDGLGEAPTHYYKYDNDTYRGLEPNEIIEKIYTEAKVIGVSCMFSIAHTFVMNLCNLVKRKFSNAFIVLGGAHASALPEYILKSDNIDFICLGESENTFLNLCESLSKNDWKVKLSDIENICGLGYKNNSRIIVNKNFKLIRDVDSIPYPDWNNLPINNYFKLKESQGSLKFDKWLVTLFSRGCSFNCSFCNTPQIWKRKWRSRDPKKVVEEIIFLQKNYGIKEIHFEDENMNTDVDKLIEFCNELMKQKIKINWQAPNGIRPHGMNEDIFSKMVKSGCTNIVLAPESGSKRVLDEIINKSLNLEEIVKASEIASKLNLKTTAYFIMGLPGERKGDIIKTLKFLIKLARKGVDECAIGLFVPLPGSKLFDQLCKEGKIKVNDEFFKSLITMDDLRKVKSWSGHISDYELKMYQFLGYLLFHVTKLLFHPFKTFHMLSNILSGKQELKTERFILSKLKKIIKSPK